MKNKLILFVVGCIFLGLWACMDSDDTEYEVSRDPQIASFSLSHDSISGLSDVVFVVDQVNGLIYNPDSMAMEYRELIDSMKVLASIEFTSYVSNIELYPQATMDTVFWTGSTEKDSIDFSERVDIKTTALDGLTTKRYQSKLNIHTVLPDTMEWKKLSWLPFGGGTITEQKVIAYHNNFLMYFKEGNSWSVRLSSFENPAQLVSAIPDFPATVKIGQLVVFDDMLLVPDEDGTLYFSVDAKEWTAVALNDVYVESILGTLTSNLLSIVVKQAGDYYFATLTVDGDEWIVNRSPDQIPEDYPLSEQNHATYNINNTPTLLVIGGARDDKFVPKVWNTNDGLKWEAYSIDSFPYRRGAAVTQYDDKLYMIGGFDEKGAATRDIFISQNRGVAWKETEIGPLPDDFAKRGFVSVIVDNEQYMHLFGGKASIDSNNVLKEIWRGRINRLGFAN